ncbi:hypothetical protein DSM106972_055840 [Dulcicalothrix desertica PCC 7102]|uniref:Bro-N domain-containing protein n=1 Tax=Dulcicalothrix desertica PCC 7102 TaxID=232991 RepID=A0A3S1D4E5_9CYAN|nr:BRO family protein [Dulcicalothrix desertica]RUT03276.1 hypothetical protein DSM106972_055840 [Dulcicalothrix desertica PCC 7102]TWH53641.1 Prophage antirepressor [Dulcicalothrix desertica PCC 7102]
MSNLTIFNFESREVRFVGTALEPEWIATDVGEVLEIQNIRQNLAEFDSDEKGVCTIYTPGGIQELATVKEAGLYKLIFKSRKPVAKRFQRWIFHSVIPTIRKTGKYELPQVEVPQSKFPIPSLEEISTLLDLTLGKAGLEPKLVAGAKLNAICKRHPHLREEAEEAKSMLLISVEDKLLAPKQLGEILTERTNEKWSAQRVNKLLIEKGFQMRNSEGNPDYLPTDKGKAHSQMTLGTAKGRDKTVQHLRWFESVLEIVEVP